MSDTAIIKGTSMWAKTVYGCMCVCVCVASRYVCMCICIFVHVYMYNVICLNYNVSTHGPYYLQVRLSCWKSLCLMLMRE